MVKWWLVPLGLVVGFCVFVAAMLYNLATNLFGPCDPYCSAWESWPVGNGSGVFAIVRREYDGGLPDDYGAVPNTVYIHRALERNGNDNLALRYYAIEEDGSLPVVRWTSRDALVVIVSAKRIVQLTRERSRVGGVAVTYRLPRAACPATNDPVERAPLSGSCNYAKQFDHFIFSSLYGQTETPGRRVP